ncbi:MAG: hypothetical protein ACYC1L_06190 [Alphaproteobacteria bacterium]
MGWNRYFVLRSTEGWFVAHRGRLSGTFADGDKAAAFAIERARAEAAGPRDLAVVLMQGRDQMLREIWSSADPNSPRYNAAWLFEGGVPRKAKG